MCRGRERHEVLPSSPLSLLLFFKKSMGLLKLFLLSFFLTFIYLFVCGCTYPLSVWRTGDGRLLEVSSLLVPCGDQELELAFSSLAASAFTCEAI